MPLDATAAQELASQGAMQAAIGRKAELMADPAWRDRYIKGDGPERVEMQALNAKIAGPRPVTEPVDPDIIEHVRSAGVSDEVVKQVETRRPISQEEYDMVARWKTAHLKDPAWRQKYFDGDYEARKQMMLANITLSSPIKEK